MEKHLIVSRVAVQFETEEDYLHIFRRKWNGEERETLIEIIDQRRLLLRSKILDYALLQTD